MLSICVSSTAATRTNSERARAASHSTKALATELEMAAANAAEPAVDAISTKLALDVSSVPMCKEFLSDLMPCDPKPSSASWSEAAASTPSVTAAKPYATASNLAGE